MGTPKSLLRVLACCLASAGCSDGVYVMFERYEVKDDERVPAGAGCMLVIDRGLGGGRSQSSGGGTADPAGDFGITERTRDDAFLVVVSSGGTELERRAYGEKFLSSGKRDEFSVTTQAGRHFELAYWGGDECDTSHLQAE